MWHKNNEKYMKEHRKQNDLIQHQVISAVSKSDVLCKSAVFKGGTMLRICMFYDYRLSEDLDFSLIDITREEFYEEIISVIESISEDSLRIYMMRSSLEGDRFIEWYDGKNSGMILVEAEPIENFAKDGIEYLSMLENHTGVLSENDILCADLLHVATSKYNCIGNRYKGRDIYDMAYMVNENILGEAWIKYLKHYKEIKRNKTTPRKIIARMNNKSEKEKFRTAWEKDVVSGYMSEALNFDETYDCLVSELNSFWYL